MAPVSAPGAVAVLVGVAALVLLLVWVAPPVLLRLVVRAYPPGHPRRGELLREFDDVAPGERLRWVASLALPCTREGATARRTDTHRVLLSRAALILFRAINDTSRTRQRQRHRARQRAQLLRRWRDDRRSNRT